MEAIDWSTSTPASAEDLENRFGSDTSNVDNAWALVRYGVHFDVSAGLWVAQLSGGLTSLAEGASAVGTTPDVTSTALGSVGTGHGLVREVKFGLQVKGNEAYFDYLSDKLFQTASEEVERHVDNPILREAILQIAGELRPDLKSLLGPDAKVWLKAEYGKFEGSIENGHVFASKNALPYFGRRTEPWETKYFGVEAGVYPDGRNASDEFKHRSGVQTGDEGIGLYGRFRKFSRPLVIGFGTEADTAEFMLTDGHISAFELGVKADILSCGDVFCFRASGYMAPFTGYAQVDYTGLGDAKGSLVSLGGELRVSLPIQIGDVFAFGPYVGFRADYLLPLVSSSTDADTSSSEFNEDLEPYALDYFFWGPNFGLMAKL